MPQGDPRTRNGEKTSPSGTEGTRRRLLKAGALLVPAVLTLRATPAWAQTDYTVTAYRYGTHAGKCRNPDYDPEALGGTGSEPFIDCPGSGDPS